MAVFILLLSASSAVGQSEDTSSVRVSVEYGPSVTISIREDIRLRRNDVYQGLRYRERYGVLKQAGDLSREYRGRLLTLEETVRGTSVAARRVESGDRVTVSLPSDGSIVVPAGRLLPRLRLVPSFPDREISVGDEWSSPGLWVADPAGDGRPFTVLVNVAYRYRGMDVHAGRPVHVFDGGYRLRYPYEVPPKLEPLVESTGFPSFSAGVAQAEGSHRLTILVSADGRRVLLVRDVLSSWFVLTDGTRLNEEGFSLMFWRTSEPVDDVVAIAEQAEDVATVDRVDEGVRLTLGNLRFRPDSDELLPGEGSRIAAIADILIRHPERKVLVVGHTADVGRPEGQLQLSVDRARAIVDALITTGVRSSRLLFEGRGAREPVAPNATEEGMAQNRRVEIILLDDQL